VLNINIGKRILTADGLTNLRINLCIKARSFVGITGDSGSGKTTLLRMISGLTSPDEGCIVADGDIWFDSVRKINLPVQKRKTGFVFQEFSLFPNMTVKENILYANKNKKEVDEILSLIFQEFSLFPNMTVKENILYANNNKKEVDEILSLTKLKTLENVYPGKLSGGQKQRVAFARAIVQKPKLLLMDEPFSSLDENMRRCLQNEMQDYHKNNDITILFVSHNSYEISRLATEIISIKNKGVVRKIHNTRSIDYRLSLIEKENIFKNQIYFN